jgi:endonuclease I
MKKTYMTLLLAAVALLASAAAPNGSGTYYQNANGKKGAQLKTALCGILWETRYNPALSYNELWTAFHTTDVRSDGKIWDMYSDNTNYEPGGSAQGHNYSGEGDSYNREHSFPASWFGSNTPMYTDLHHIYPTDGYINNRRSNYPFGETNGNTYKSHNSFSKLGSCTVSGYTGTVFEPADEYKGDFARTYFYMVTCYEEKLADWYSKNAESRTTIDGSTYPGFQTWQLNMLLAWAAADPVSDKETARNNAVKNIQGNRNPFIDYPGLEQYIWGSKKNDAFSYDNYVQPDGSSSGSGGGGDDPGPGPEPSGDDKTITLTYDSFGLTTSYAVKTATIDGYGFTVNQGYKGNGNTIQMNSSKGSGILYNTTAIPGLKSITVNVASGSNTYTITTGTSQTPTANSQTGTTGGTYNAASGDTYFQLKVSGGSYFSSIVITYNEGGDEPVDPTFNGLTDLSVNWETSLTLTKGTTGTPNFVTDGTVTISSLNEDVVTVSGLTITPHAVGTAMISVSTTATDAYNAGSVMFPITVNAPEVKTTAAPTATAVFTETFDESTGNSGWSGTAANGTAVFDNNGWGKNYTYGNGGSIRIGKGSGQGYVITPALGTAGDLTLTFKSGAWDGDKTTGGLVLSVEAGGGTLSTTTFDLSNARWTTYSTTITGATAETRIKFSAAQSSNNRFFLDDVVVTKPGVTLTKTLNSDGYASYCSEYPLDFSDYESAGYSAWQVTGVSGETINFAQVTGTVKGGTGLILKGIPNATITLHSAASTTTLDDNLLVGTIVNTYAETGQYFGLKGNAFVPVAESTVPEGKALLPASLIDNNEVKVLNFVFEDDATGISLMEDGRSQMEDGAIYNLAGQRLDNSQLKRGIYIVNGKKVLK